MHIQSQCNLEPSYPKLLLVAGVQMLVFIAVVCMFLPLDDPLLIGMLVFMSVVMPFVFAGGMCFMLRCKMDPEGLRPAVPTFYQRLIRWEDISSVSGISFPFYLVWSRGFAGRCLLPRPWLLKNPGECSRYLAQHAPVDSLLRQRFAA